MISYVIYKNLVSAGPVDLSAPYGTSATLTFDTSALAYPFTHNFLVRSYDTVTGIEDVGTDARVTIVLDAAGSDVTGRPAAPIGLSAQAIANGGIRVEWSYLPVPGAAAPTSFRVWAQVGTLNYALAPDATASPYDPDRSEWSADIAGLADGVTYTVGVRATNASGDETNTATVTVTADATGPLPVAALAGRPTY